MFPFTYFCTHKNVLQFRFGFIPLDGSDTRKSSAGEALKIEIKKEP